MKITIDFKDPQVQVSYVPLTIGGQLIVSLWSGGRYDHYVEVYSKSQNVVTLAVIAEDDGEYKGYVTFTAETDREKKVFSSRYWHLHEKETYHFLFVDATLITKRDGSVLFDRNFKP